MMMLSINRCRCRHRIQISFLIILFVEIIIISHYNIDAFNIINQQRQQTSLVHGFTTSSTTYRQRQKQTYTFFQFEASATGDNDNNEDSIIAVERVDILKKKKTKKSKSKKKSNKSKQQLDDDIEPTTTSKTTRKRIRLKGGESDYTSKNRNNINEDNFTKNRTNNTTNKRQQQQQQRRGRDSNNNNENNNSNNNNHRQLNKDIVAADDYISLLKLLQTNAKLSSVGAGGTLNSVNFSTALHRLARHAVTNNNNSNSFKQNRAVILSDPRTALLLASIGEAMSTTNTIPLQQSRELSNIVWALAKLKLPPPLSAMSSIIISNDNSENSNMDRNLLLQNCQKQLESSSAAVRKAVLDVAASQRNGDGSKKDASTWILPLSQLAGYILDTVGAVVLATTIESSSTNNNNNNKKIKKFQLQEWANLLWAWATAGRAHSDVFGAVVQNMIQQQKQQDNNDIHNNNNNNSNNNRSLSNKRPQEWSNSIWAFATAQCYNNHIELLQFVANMMENDISFVKQYKTQELSNTAWGIATLLSNKQNNVIPTSDDNNNVVGFDDDNDDNVTTLTEAEEEAALTILRVVAKELIEQQAKNWRTQELANTAWAMATLGFGLHKSQDQITRNNYVILHSDQPEVDAQLMEQAINCIVHSAQRQLQHFWSQELNNLTWALARLLSDNPLIEMDAAHENVRELLYGIGDQIADPTRSVTSQDIGTTLWGMANLEFFDDDLFRAIAARLTSPNNAGRAYKPQELSNTIWSFATAGVRIEDKHYFDIALVPASQRPERISDPVVNCFAVAANELMKRPYQFKAQEIKDVLWSFSKVGIRHPDLFKSIAQHLVGQAGNDDDVPCRGLNEFSPQGLGNMAWAFARQAQLADEVLTQLGLGTTSGRLSVYRVSKSDIGEQLLQKLFASIAEANIRVHDELRKGKPQDIANTAWSFAVLGFKHQTYLDMAKQVLYERSIRFEQGDRSAMTRFKGQELANLLWALATLNVKPDNCLEALERYLKVSCTDSSGEMSAASIAQVFNRQELANMAWCCAVFGSYREGLMNFLYRGLLGIGKERNPSYLSSIYNDQGLQNQAILTLIYVQAAMDMTGRCQNLSLPDDFPDSWQQQQSPITQSKYDDHMTDTFELNLSTSKIQRAVSSAFTRIGFDHVEELTIDMNELSRKYKVRVPPKQTEVLSMDIANPEVKVAVEVDGPAHFITRIEDIDQTRGVGGFTKMINGVLEYQFEWTGEHQEINGSTALKQRLLNYFGWKVIHMPFWEWYALDGDEAAEDAYCSEILNRE